MKQKTLCVYHSADFDGLFSGAVVYAFANYMRKDYDLDMVGWDFGDELVDTIGYDKIIVVDLPPDCLVSVDWNKLTWIDHHKTAIERFTGCFDGLTIDGVAACRLAWNYFFGDGNGQLEEFVGRKIAEPYCITLAGEHDVWNHDDPLAMGFQFGLNALKSNWTPQELAKEFLKDNCNISYTRWNDGFNDSKTANVAQSGKLIEQWQNNFAANVCEENSYLVEFEGLEFCALASVHARMSTWFPEETIKGGVALMNIRISGDGKARISLYHRTGYNEIDLSVIAKKYGGGGHKGACGFEITIDEAVTAGIIR